MNISRAYLGIDTSNYRTSVAVVSADGKILVNKGKLLDVPKGKRGLRQQEALFGHINALPELIDEAMEHVRTENLEISGISASDRPRPVEGSYMPCFLAGENAGRMLASALGVPFRTYSHQEGHLEAAMAGNDLTWNDRFCAFHFSGGTTEAILVGGGILSIVGGSKDISYGQFLDRVGVACGLDFPSGAAMDEMAEAGKPDAFQIPAIKEESGYVNLSGIETHCIREVLEISESKKSDYFASIFRAIATSIASMMKSISRNYSVDRFLFAGGVSESSYIRSAIQDTGFDITFAGRGLSGDNAVGTALLGRRDME